jgi:bifunctional non-homologous end joining protein LigD
MRNAMNERICGAKLRGLRCRCSFRQFPSAPVAIARQLYAFDILALDGEDLRGLPLHLRKTNLARLLARRPEGIFVSDYEQGEIGPKLFLQACKFGLAGMVSKRRDRPYRAGRSLDWVKVKNRSHPSLARVKDAFS